MRRQTLRVLAVVVLLATATPTFAAPRRNDSYNPFERAFTRLVQLIKGIVHPLDTTDPTFPKP